MGEALSDGSDDHGLWRALLVAALELVQCSPHGTASGTGGVFGLTDRLRLFGDFLGSARHLAAGHRVIRHALNDVANNLP